MVGYLIKDWCKYWQAILCYLPHFLWKSMEGGKISLLIQDLDAIRLEGSSGTENKRSVGVP
jgi:hypothetical protein